jgi:hypothetical protein
MTESYTCSPDPLTQATLDALAGKPWAQFYHYFKTSNEAEEFRFWLKAWAFDVKIEDYNDAPNTWRSGFTNTDGPYRFKVLYRAKKDMNRYYYEQSKEYFSLKNFGTRIPSENPKLLKLEG